MLFLLLTSVLLYAVNVEGGLHGSVCHDTKGYYWRDYTGGDIPSDALVGGKDNVGNPIYIGQTIYPQVGVVVPGKLSSTTFKMYFEFDRTEHPITEDVKVLCSTHPEQFHWVPTESSVKVSNLLTGNKQLVIGGHDRPHLVTIGRKTHNGQVLVGKVLVINGEFEGIHLTEDGKGWQEASFEVLLYNPTTTDLQEG